MQFKIIPFDNNYRIYKNEKLISDLININTGLNSIFRLFKLCCLENTKKVIIYNNPDSEFCLYCKHDIFNTIIYIIKNILSIKDIDISIEYQLLLIAEMLDSSKDLIYKILDYIKWPSGEKGFDYFISFKNFSKKLKDFVFKKYLSLSDAYFFHEYFIGGYDELLKIFPEKLTFTERSSIIRNITEFAKKNKNGIKDIIKLLKDVKDTTNKLNFIDFSNNLRYPKRSKYNSFFTSELNKINLPKGVNINFDDTFEREDYSMKIRFNNYNSLLNKINQVKKSLEKRKSNNDFIDFFDHDVIFKNNEE